MLLYEIGLWLVVACLVVEANPQISDQLSADQHESFVQADLKRPKRFLPILDAVIGDVGQTIIGVGTGILGAKAGVKQGLVAGRLLDNPIYALISGVHDGMPVQMNNPQPVNRPTYDNMLYNVGPNANFVPGNPYPYGSGNANSFNVPSNNNGYPWPGNQNGYPWPGNQNGQPWPGNQNGYPWPGNQNGYPWPGNQNGYPGPGNQNGYPGPGNQNGYPGPGNQNGYPGPGNQNGYPGVGSPNGSNGPYYPNGSGMNGNGGANGGTWAGSGAGCSASNGIPC